MKSTKSCKLCGDPIDDGTLCLICQEGTGEEDFDDLDLYTPIVSVGDRVRIPNGEDAPLEGDVISIEGDKATCSIDTHPFSKVTIEISALIQ